MKKNLSPAMLTIFIFIMAAVFNSCKKNDNDVIRDVGDTSMIQNNVKEQIRLSQENMAASQLPVKIINYKFESDIKDDIQLSAVRDKLVDGDYMVPNFDGLNAASFSISSIKERMESTTANNGQNVVENIRQFALPKIQKGQKVLDILWESKGKQFHSKCIYNADSIVYDNMLSNIILLKEEKTPEEEIKASADSLIGNRNDGTLAQYHFTATVLDYTIKWLWGSTRGKIIIKHYIIWNGSNYIIDHGGTTDAWMTAGDAKARWANNYLSRNSRSKMAWGYGWATPTASFNIEFNSSSLTFSTGTSGVGSQGSGSGVHTIYLP